MLRYPCLVLDHDDTVVQSETTVNYPYFCYILNQFRPGMTITAKEYTKGCFHPGFVDMCRQTYCFTEEELQAEYWGWKEYIKSHVPAPYPGVRQIIHRQKAEGGLVCVVSHSSHENIRRDYQTHFGILPDQIFGSDLPMDQWKPSTYPLEQIMQTYGLAPNQILVVDDLKPAWQMARAVGSPIAFAAWSKTEVPEIIEEMELLCDFSFHQVKELYQFLFGDDRYEN